MMLNAIEGYQAARAAYDAAWEQVHAGEAQIVEAFNAVVAVGVQLPCEYDPECGTPARQLIHLKPCCDRHAQIHGAAAAQTAQDLMGG